MGWMTRFLTAIAFLAVGVIFSPETFGSKSAKITTFVKLAHLLCFSTAWGAALWVTFIGGIIMFKNNVTVTTRPILIDIDMFEPLVYEGVPVFVKLYLGERNDDFKIEIEARLNLPRHQFGNLQSKMFPAYFMMVGICCAVSVGCFGYTHPWKLSATAEKYQLGFLVAAFVFNLTNLFVFTPMTIEMMKQRHKIERESNIGEEVGWTKNQEVAKVNPKLAAMNKKFGMIHGLSSLANIMSFGSLAMHSWYLAGKLDL
ncbi:transmembrane protein 205 [Tanacetum coccineum]